MVAICFLCPAVLLGGVFGCSPTPTEYEPPPPPERVMYFPTTVGDTRVYQMLSVRSGALTTERVVAVEEKDGNTLLVSVQEVGPNDPPTTEYEVSAGNVTFRSLFMYVPMFSISARKGGSWRGEVDLGINGRPRIHYAGEGEEEVEVPAGKFTAIRITEQTEILPGEWIDRATSWWAPRVGVVKRESEVNGGQHTKVLKSFISGKVN